MLSPDYLRSILDYDRETGVFTWKVRRRCQGGRTVIGAQAGFVRGCDGYVFIGIDGTAYPAQKLAWLHVTGEWPIAIVDHKSRDRADNRFDNLRLATQTENNQNKSIRSDNASGVTGVSFDDARGRWAARLKTGGKYLHLGRFATIDDAVAARRAAERKHFGEFAPA
jgi:hypothetical protein